MGMKLCLALLLAVAHLMAQFDAAEVLGTVRDNSGAVVSRANILLANQGTGIEAKTITGEDGNFTFSNVRIGGYTVTAEALLVDKALEGRTNLIGGANKEDHHFKNITPGRDFQPTAYADLRSVTAGEDCPNCGGTLRIDTAVEIGHIFKLGTKYSESMGAKVLTADGKEVPIVMGSYGIGVERIITAAIEQNHDADGIIWPKSISPFDVVVTLTNVKDEKIRDAGEKLYTDLRHAGLDVLLDDRDERAGVKFKDADLIGIPYRITLGKKISEGVVELFDRRARQSEDVKVDDIVSRVQKLALAGS
jgi:prolyl-tRNA synthetase